MKREISLEALTLADIQPSRFYISGEMLRRVLTWFDPAALLRLFRRRRAC